ncbi:hypothetical protein DH2020_045701 [Rehmannia glutinosa]|uniref:Poly(A) RNA polymerase mitochondrial-like central palm domain-containing protein n=1 Tax=Rehmannia glutinosa TaxID=99300 RepID=A0ABR0UEE3_REHGL
MNSRQQLLDSLTAHISLYHSQTPTRNPNPAPNPNTRPAALRWFSSLSLHQRRAHLTILDPNFIAILLQMKEKLQSHGCGRFIILPDLPQNDNPALPTLCYRKSEGLLSRFSESNCAEHAIHDSVELFSSTEGERDGKGDGFLCLDAMCVSEGLVEDVSRFVGVIDKITNGEFFRGGEEGEMAGDWVELGWLKEKGYYSMEEFVVNRMEVALRLAWLNSNSGKKRGVKLKEKLSVAGVAANLFWRKKGCVDWWEKLDGSVKKKVYCAYLGKAARNVTADIVNGKVSFLDDKMWCRDDQDKQLLKCDLTSLGRRDIASLRRTDSEIKWNANPAQVSGNLSPLHCIFNSLYILQVISTLLSAAQYGGYNNIFFSSLDCVNSISDIILRKLRELLMVVSLDCTKFELLGEGNMNPLTKKLNDKHVATNRKKKGKNRNRKSNPVPRPCEDDSKPIDPTKGKEDGILSISNENIKQPTKFDCESAKKDLARGNILSADAMEPVKGVNNGKLRGGPRKSKKERKKLKSSGSNGSEVGSFQSRCTRVSSASVNSQDGPSTSDLTIGGSTCENVSNNVGIHVDRLDADANLCSNLTADNLIQHADNGYSTETDGHVCPKHHVNLGSAVQSGAESTGDDSFNCDLDSGSTTIEPLVECNDKICTRVNGSGSYATGYLGKQMKGGEEVKHPLVQEQGSLSLLRVGAISSPAYVSYEWPNVAPLHPSTNTHRPAATDRLHLDVGHNLQNRFHHSFLQTLQVRNSPIDNNAYNGIISRPLPMSLDWPPVVRGVNRLVPSVTCNYDTEFISRRQSSFQQGITAQSVQCGAATSEDERTVSSELMDFPDVPNSQEPLDEQDKNWMSEEELETHAVNGMDYNQYFGGGVMYWNPSDHPATTFSRPPSLCSDDSSWAWREADMNRAVDDMVAFSSSYSTNGLTSPSTASFCTPFDPLGPGALGYVMPGSEISNKVLHSSSTMADGGAEESVSGSMSNISTEHPRIKRPPSPVVLCVPHAPRPPPPSPVGDSRKHRGFPTVRSGSSSPRHWGVKGWFHDGVSFEESCLPMEGSEVVWPSWRNKGLSTRQLTQPLAVPLLQDRLIAISQLARDQEHPDVILPLQPPESQNCSTRKASLSLIHDILHDEIDSFCKQVAAENLIRKPYINWAVKRVARSLQVLWPRSRTNIFGSNATGLSLPSSDVDLVVCLPPVRNLEPIKEAGILEGRNGIKETCLQHAARYLANQEWVKSDSLKIVENTAIPIIMLVVEVPHDLISTLSNVQTPKEEADKLASEGGNLFKTDSTTSEVKDLTERFPAVTPLTLVLKQFLADRSLDQSYSGGLSSYCLILLITRFLQHEHHHGRPINQAFADAYTMLENELTCINNDDDTDAKRTSDSEVDTKAHSSMNNGIKSDPPCLGGFVEEKHVLVFGGLRMHRVSKKFAASQIRFRTEITLVALNCCNPASSRWHE